MSMDDQFEQMQYFRDALMRFNEQLRGSMTDLERQHENVSPHWQDEMRRQYDSQWQPLDSMMKHYLNVEAPSYVEFLSIKIHALGRYLRGG